MNEVKLIGFTGKDATVSKTQKGNTFLSVSICTDDGYFNKEQNTYIKIDNWHNITAFGKLAESLADLKKGELIFVNGSLTSRIWERENNIKQTVVEVNAKEIHRLVKFSKANTPPPPEDRRSFGEPKKVEEDLNSRTNPDDLPF